MSDYVLWFKWGGKQYVVGSKAVHGAGDVVRILSDRQPYETLVTLVTLGRDVCNVIEVRYMPDKLPSLEVGFEPIRSQIFDAQEVLEPITRVVAIEGTSECRVQVGYEGYVVPKVNICEGADHDPGSCCLLKRWEKRANSAPRVTRLSVEKRGKGGFTI